jgi:hypothetical protein
MAEPCDNYPDWQGCECCGLDGRFSMPKGHDGPHICVCGARWDDDGRPLGLDGEPTGLALPRGADNDAIKLGA